MIRNYELDYLIWYSWVIKAFSLYFLIATAVSMIAVIYLGSFSLILFLLLGAEWILVVIYFYSDEDKMDGAY